MRVALNDAAPLYRHAPEAMAAKAAGAKIFETFMQQLLPQTSQETRLLAGELITTTLSTVGHSFSETPRSAAQIKIWADAMADMFCAYLAEISKA